MDARCRRSSTPSMRAPSTTSSSRNGPASSPTLPLQVTTADNDRHGPARAGLIYADSRGMLEDRIAALREANIYERQRYRHLVGLPVMLGEDDGDGATSRRRS